MTKKVAWASVRVPDYPRVRFFRKAADGKGTVDVTDQVAKLELDENGNGVCILSRLDANGALLWQTRHPSLQEAKWYCEFEYGLPDDKWVPLD